jgi:hypothetical protein
MTATPFFKLTGAFLVGVISLLAALLIFALFLPVVLAFFAIALPFLAGAALILTAVVILWILIYFSIMIGVGIYYAVRHPMKVNAAHGASYGVSHVREAGVSGKGHSAAHPHHTYKHKPLKVPVHPSKKAADAAKSAAKRRAAKKKR